MHINARLPYLSTGLFKLRNILLIVMLTVLALPLCGLYFFRIYENELVRQTELDLIAQAATLSASYRQWLRLLYPDRAREYGKTITVPTSLNTPPSILSIPSERAKHRFTPVIPQLDLTEPIELPRPDAVSPRQAPDEISGRIGALMQPIMKDTQRVTLSGIRILDAHGTVVAGREEKGLSLAHVSEVAIALTGEYASIIRQRISDEPPPPLYSISRGTNIRVFIAFPILEENRLLGVMYLSRTPNNIIKHLYAVYKVIMTAAISLLCIAILLVLFVSSTISRPIRELILQTERVVKGEQRTVEPLKHPVTYEVAQLSKSFYDMSRTLAERSDYIRQFAAHVSHEFKTPLTSIQGALELFQEHLDEMDAARRQRFLDNLIKDTQRLKNLVTRLLELARADAIEPARQKQTVLHDLLNACSHRYVERGLLVRYEGLPAVAVAIAPDVMETILKNLLDNSLQHQATVVTLSLQRVGQEWQLDVSDNGEGVSVANRSKIFTPFFTTRRSKGGTGLGLEIIQSLLRAYHGDLSLVPTETGATFRIVLPYHQAI